MAAEAVSTEQLGVQLRTARQQLGLTLEDAERDTLIRTPYLQALEEGKFTALPPDIYVRRIVEAYGEYLGLDTPALLRRFFAERDAFLKTEARFQPLNLDKLGRRQPFSIPTFFNAHRLMTLAGSFLALAAVTGYFALQVNNLSAAPHLDLAEPRDGVTVAHRQVLIRGTTELGMSVAVNNQQVLTDESGQFSVPFELSRGQNTIVVLATDKNGRATRVARTVTADFVEEPLVAPARPANGFVASLTADAPAWVHVELDGRVAFEGLLPEDAEKEFTGTDTLSVRTGNAGVTRVAINGQDQGVLGKTGQVATYSYDRDKAVGMAGEREVEE